MEEMHENLANISMIICISMISTKTSQKWGRFAMSTRRFLTSAVWTRWFCSFWHCSYPFSGRDGKKSQCLAVLGYTSLHIYAYTYIWHMTFSAVSMHYNILYDVSLLYIGFMGKNPPVDSIFHRVSSVVVPDEATRPCPSVWTLGNHCWRVLIHARRIGKSW